MGLNSQENHLQRSWKPAAAAGGAQGEWRDPPRKWRDLGVLDVQEKTWMWDQGPVWDKGEKTDTDP